MQKFKRGSVRGAALVEYGLLVGLIAVVSIFSVSRLGEQVSDTFSDIAAELDQGEWWSDATYAFRLEIGMSGNPNSYGYQEGAYGVLTSLGSEELSLQNISFSSGSLVSFYMYTDLSEYSAGTLECEFEGARYSDDLWVYGGPAEHDDTYDFNTIPTSLPMPVSFENDGKTLTCAFRLES